MQKGLLERLHGDSQVTGAKLGAQADLMGSECMGWGKVGYGMEAMVSSKKPS